MKSVLLLTASTGGGHNQAARALEDIYKNQGYTVETLDIFKDSNEKLDALMVEGYAFLATKMPRTYGDLYWLSNKKIINKPLCDAIARKTWKALHRDIQRIHPALIVSTHPFAIEIVAKIKRHNRLECPYLAVVTDFIAHQTYLSPAVDAYIVGSQWTKKDLAGKGVEASRIHALGIPTRKEFYQPLTWQTSQAASDPIRVLAMAGSLGLEEMSDCLSAIITDSAAKITAVCGNNQILYETLSKQFQKEIRSGRMTLYGFTKNIKALMDSHDCIMTKPGGLTTTESILRQIPMVIPFMIPGQETENTTFLVEEGMAVYAAAPEDLAVQITLLEDQPHRLQLMRARMKEVADTYSPEGIFLLSERLQKKGENPMLLSTAAIASCCMTAEAKPLRPSRTRRLRRKSISRMP